MVFKQIAGLIARRIVFRKQPGDRVAAGERVGLIKFGSRVDVLFGPGMGNRGAPRRARLGRLQRDRPPLATEVRPMGLRERLVDPRSPDRRPRRAAYALPTLFTAGQHLPGLHFHPALVSRRHAGGFGRLRARRENFAVAAEAIGAAVFLDGLDGRIARMTNTISDFGREMDSLADVISFGIAPAVLAFAWGVQFVDPGFGEACAASFSTPATSSRFCSCCAAPRAWRASTFRRTPSPRIPAGPTASISSACPFPPPPAWWPRWCMPSTPQPMAWWPLSVAWLALLALLGFLMVSTWRYYSFKGINLEPRLLAADPDPAGRLHLFHLELFAAGAADHGSGLRGQRHRHSHGRHRAAAPAPAPASSRLRSIKLADNTTLLPWWAARR